MSNIQRLIATVTLFALAVLACMMCSCSRPTPLQQAMSQQMAASSRFGASLTGAPQANSSFETFYGRR